MYEGIMWIPAHLPVGGNAAYTHTLKNHMSPKIQVLQLGLELISLKKLTFFF